MMRVFYMRVVFALSATKKKVIFVVIRTFLRIDLSVCARRGFSSDVDERKHVRRHVQTNRRALVFYRA